MLVRHHFAEYQKVRIHALVEFLMSTPNRIPRPFKLSEMAVRDYSILEERYTKTTKLIVLWKKCVL